MNSVINAASLSSFAIAVKPGKARRTARTFPGLIKTAVVASEKQARIVDLSFRLYFRN
jgi:hypothetical protein